MRLQRGVTLVELMIAVALMFVIGALAIPAYRGYLETSRQEVLLARAVEFQMFMANYRVENGTYLAGKYDPAGGVNDFEIPLGYKVDNDNSGISFKVDAGACGNIAECYQILLVNSDGEQLTWTPSGWEFAAN